MHRAIRLQLQGQPRIWENPSPYSRLSPLRGTGAMSEARVTRHPAKAIDKVAEKAIALSLRQNRCGRCALGSKADSPSEEIREIWTERQGPRDASEASVNTMRKRYSSDMRPSPPRSAPDSQDEACSDILPPDQRPPTPSTGSTPNLLRKPEIGRRVETPEQVGWLVQSGILSASYPEAILVCQNQSEPRQRSKD